MPLLSKVKDIFKGGSSSKKKKVYHNVRLENPEDCWDIVGELGDGAYGKVYKAQRKDNGQMAALKQVVLEGEDDLETYMIEVDILAECKHPNVVELLEAYHFDGKLWMYLEYCDGGAVDSIMVDLDRALTEPQIATLCYGICNALLYIHANKVIHRDLKAGNVLLTMEGGVKLADFGVSAKNKNTFDKRGTFIGTPYWLAPEVILCETFIDAKYDYKADIWSLGISLIEFAQMDPPNHEVSPVRVMLKIQKSDPPKLDFPSRWSKEFNDFIAKCLTKDPVLRPNAEDLLKHPFLNKSLDLKPIVDLLLEYKAEVVEEEVDDDSEDQGLYRPSTVPEPFSNSRYDTDSLISLDKDSTLQPNDDDKLPTPNSDDREIGTAISSERRMSKGPAPLPPVVTTSSQPSPKKGPAPAVPSVSLSATSSKIDSSITSISSATLVSSETKLINSTHTVTSSAVVTSPDSLQVPHSAMEDTSLESNDHITSTPTSETPKSAPSLSPVGSPIVAPAPHIPEEIKLHEGESRSILTPESEKETSAIDSIPIGKSVLVYDTEAYKNKTVTVNSVNVSKANVKDVINETVIETEFSVVSSEITKTTATHTQISMDGDIKPCLDSPQPSIGDSKDESPSLPVTLSVVPPSSAPEVKNTQGSDVLLASISSEGTVIVRTPTPTPTTTTTPPLSAASTDVNSQVALKTESVVTYTVTGESPLGLKTETSQETTIPVSAEESYPRISVPSVGTLSPDSPTSPKSPDFIGEAETEAVFILETAINSAMDTTSIKTSENTSGLSSPSSITQEDLMKEVKGEVVVVASEKNAEVDSGMSDTSGHKLDESEVLISSSSIPEDEQKEQLQARIETSLEEQSASLNDTVTTTTTTTENDEVHISVVAVAEKMENDNVTIIQDESKVTSEVVVDGGETKQMSLTIEGTTLEDTDVDEVENPSTNVSETLPQSTVNAFTDKDSVITIEDNTHSTVTTVTTPTTTSSTPSVEDRDKVPPKMTEEEGTPLKPIQNGVRRQNSRASDRSDTDTTSTVGSDKENRHLKDDNSDFGEEVTLRNPVRRPNLSPVLNETAAKNLKNKELQESIALRKKTRKRTRKFVIDGVVVTTTTSKVIYGDDEEQGMLSSAHLKRKQELRELKLLQKREQKQFQDLGVKANIAKQEQEKKFETEKTNLLRNYDSQIENLVRQQKQMVEKAEGRQESELKIESKKTRADQERELKAFRESLKQEWKLLKQEVDLLPKEKRKENFKIRKEQLEKGQSERERACLERLNDSHEMALKRLNDKHRQHIALKERQFLEEKHQLLRARESALWDMEERHIQDKHQLAKEQLKDIYFLQRLQMTIRHNIELEQVRRYNQQKEEDLLKRQQEERRQLPKRIRQEMKTREKMFREQIRISMTNLPSHDQEKDQLKKFQEQEKIKYDKERKRAEMKHKKQMEELNAATESSIKELVHLQNEKGKLLTEHETYKLKSLDEEYQKELKEWKSNLAPRKQKLEEDFERQLREQEKFYGDYLERGLGLSTPSQSTASLASSHH